MFIPFLIFRSFVQLLWACGFEGIEAGRITSYWTPFVWRPLHLQPSPPSGSNLAATCCIYDESREGNDPSRPWRDLITRYVSLDRDSWLQGGHWNVSVAVGLRWVTGSGHRMTSLWYSWSSIQGRENRSACNRNYIRSQKNTTEDIQKIILKKSIHISHVNLLQHLILHHFGSSGQTSFEGARRRRETHCILQLIGSPRCGILPFAKGWNISLTPWSGSSEFSMI